MGEPSVINRFPHTWPAGRAAEPARCRSLLLCLAFSSPPPHRSYFLYFDWHVLNTVSPTRNALTYVVVCESSRVLEEGLIFIGAGRASRPGEARAGPPRQREGGIFRGVALRSPEAQPRPTAAKLPGGVRALEHGGPGHQPSLPCSPKERTHSYVALRGPQPLQRDSGTKPAAPPCRLRYVAPGPGRASFRQGSLAFTWVRLPRSPGGASGPD